MKIYFERNNSGLTYLEINDEGLVMMCNNHMVWGEFWIGCMVPDLQQLKPGDILLYFDTRKKLKKTPFKIINIEGKPAK